MPIIVIIWLSFPGFETNYLMEITTQASEAFLASYRVFSRCGKRPEWLRNSNPQRQFYRYSCSHWFPSVSLTPALHTIASISLVEHPPQRGKGGASYNYPPPLRHPAWSGAEAGCSPGDLTDSGSCDCQAKEIKGDLNGGEPSPGSQRLYVHPWDIGGGGGGRD